MRIKREPLAVEMANAEYRIGAALRRKNHYRWHWYLGLANPMNVPILWNDICVYENKGDYQGRIVPACEYVEED